jgi:hypothetical protein
MIAAYLPLDAVQTRIRRAWAQHVVPALATPDHTAMLSALVVASTCVDEVIEAKGFPGALAGERLWHARRSFSSFDALLDARRVRNRAVHHLDYRLNAEACTLALASLAVALRDQGVVLGGA